MRGVPALSRSRSRRLIFAIFVLLTTSIILPASPAHAAPPSNDAFSGAINAASLPFQHTVNTTEATETGEPQQPCANGLIWFTVWYRFEPPASLPPVNASTWGSDFDTVLAVYEANGVGSGIALADLVPIACNDNATGTALRSSVTLVPEVGKTYFFQLGGKDRGRGTALFNLGVSPDNDLQGDALGVTALPFTDNLSTVGATHDTGTCSSIGSSVWYRYQPPSTTHLSADTSGSAFDTVLIAYRQGTDGSLTSLGCNDNTSATATHSFLPFYAEAGKTYYIQVGGTLGRQGYLSFTLREAAVASHDDFASARSAAPLPFHETTANLLATRQPSEPSNCQMGDATAWYQFSTSSSIGSLVASTAGSGFDTSLAVFTGSGLGSLSLVGCNNDVSPLVLTSRLTFTPSTSTTYWIQAGTRAGILPKTLVFDLRVPDNNDTFANAVEVPLAQLPFVHEVNTSLTSTESGEPTSCGSVGYTVWYRLSPAADMLITLSTSGSSFSPTVGIYSGTAINALTNVACKTTSEATEVFEAEGGTTYHLQAGSLTGDGTGDLKLTLTGATLPAHDDFAEALEITSLSSPFATSTSAAGATTETGEPGFSCSNNYRTIWFKHTASSGDLLTADTFGSPADTKLSVSTGTALSSLVAVAGGCNDNHSAGSTLNSAVTFTPTSGTTYYFQVGVPFASLSTDFTFNLRKEAAPANDAFASATEVPSALAYQTTPTFADAVRTVAATTESGEPGASGCLAPAKTVWYKFVPTQTALVLINTFGSNFDTIIDLHQGTTLAGLTSSGVCNNNIAPGYQSKIEFTAQAGTTYYLRAGGASNQGGILHVAVQAFLVPENDLLANATAITSLPATHTVTSTSAASRQTGEPQPNDPDDGVDHCGQSGKTVWYKYTPTAPKLLAVDTFPSGGSFNTVIAVYTTTTSTASVADLTFVDCNNDHHLGTGLQSSFAFDALAGNTYYIQVGGYFGVGGALTFHLKDVTDMRSEGDPIDTPVNMNLITPVGGKRTHQNQTFSSDVTATTAGRDAAEGQPCGGIAATVWYRFSPSTPMELIPTATPTDGDFRMVMATYVEGPTGDLTLLDCVAQSEPGVRTTSSAPIQASAGVTYKFQVGGYQGDSGTFTFELETL